MSARLLTDCNIDLAPLYPQKGEERVESFDGLSFLEGPSIEEPLNLTISSPKNGKPRLIRYLKLPCVSPEEPGPALEEQFLQRWPLLAGVL